VRTIEELCGSYEGNAAKTRDAAASAFERGAYPVAASVWAESAVSYLMRAMIGWRAALDDPRPWLDACVDVSEIAAMNLITQPQWARQFNFAPGSYSAVLRDRVAGPLFEHISPGDPGATRSLPPEASRDAFLVALLAKDGANLGETFRAPESSGRLALMRRSFDTYVQLAQAGQEPADRLRLTSDAVANYRARRQNGYYAGGLRSEGGGEYNDLLVDYRLAAIWRRNRWSTAGLDPGIRIHLLPDSD
jgi:hypothetical protein